MIERLVELGPKLLPYTCTTAAVPSSQNPVVGRAVEVGKSSEEAESEPTARPEIEGAE